MSRARRTDTRWSPTPPRAMREYDRTPALPRAGEPQPEPRDVWARGRRSGLPVVRDECIDADTGSPPAALPFLHESGRACWVATGDSHGDVARAAEPTWPRITPSRAGHARGRIAIARRGAGSSPGTDGRPDSPLAVGPLGRRDLVVSEGCRIGIPPRACGNHRAACSRTCLATLVEALATERGPRRERAGVPSGTSMMPQPASPPHDLSAPFSRNRSGGPPCSGFPRLGGTVSVPAGALRDAG